MNWTGAEWHTHEGRRGILRHVQALLGPGFVLDPGNGPDITYPVLVHRPTNAVLSVQPSWRDDFPFWLEARCNRHYKLRSDGRFSVEKVRAAFESIPDLYRPKAVVV